MVNISDCRGREWIVQQHTRKKKMWSSIPNCINTLYKRYNVPIRNKVVMRNAWCLMTENASHFKDMYLYYKVKAFILFFLILRSRYTRENNIRLRRNHTVRPSWQWPRMWVLKYTDKSTWNAKQLGKHQVKNGSSWASEIDGYG